jgi:modulator of FtsH protease
MNDFRPSLSRDYAGSAGQQVLRNRVMRNTYWLLAVSMIPTVAGAAVGLMTGLNQIMASSPIMTVVIFLAGAFGLMFAIEKNRNSSLGVALLLLFTFFMGIMLSRLLGFVFGLGNGTQLVMLAFGGTAAVFGGMSILANTIKRDLSGLNRWLFIGMIMILVAALANMFFQIPALMLTVSVLAIGIFSAFILVDLQRIVNGGETNYVSATLALYISLYNVFSNLLMLLGIFGGNDE